MDSAYRIFKSNGKLMLTGEYLVLKGAKSLALPTCFGQSMNISHNSSGILNWNAFEKDSCWFSAEFSLANFTILTATSETVALKLRDTIIAAKELNSDFLRKVEGAEVITKADFNLKWGLGSSSTLISNIAQWAQCNPYLLNSMIFGGSGYDIACANANSAIIYTLNNNSPEIETVVFNPSFSKNLYFVWLNQKQNTREEIARFRKNKNYSTEIEQLNEITSEIINCGSLAHFQSLLEKHERIISNVIGLEPVQQRLFSDFKGSMKSLGAWGGDFIIAASEFNYAVVKEYFNQKGFQTVLQFNELFNF